MKTKQLLIIYNSKNNSLVYPFYHLFKAKANLHTNEMNVLVWFYINNSILAE